MTARTDDRNPETLRPEAGPLPYNRLDEQQKIALARIVNLLTAATEAAKEKRPVSSQDRAAGPSTDSPAQPRPQLSTAQSGRNILVGGERGTGKTTMLLSLASILATTRLESGREPSLDNTLPEPIASQARELRRRLVWLETLDMEPLAENVNLLGAVLARVEDAFGARFPGMDVSPGKTSLLYPGESFHDVSHELARLQTGVALTIDGNLLARAGSLDPDTFAIESRRTERERLGLDRRFATVLARLSEALSKTLELTDPVFVLPVDDVDLNVRGCVPLLRLLRAVSSPHLVIVLAADIALLGTILSLSFRGDLARIGWPGSTTSRDERVAVDLAASALRKHLPPAQRVILGLVEPWHAFALTPLEPGADSLGTAIGHIELPSDQAALWAPGDFGLPLEEVALTPVVSGGFWPAETRPEAGPLARRLAPFSWPLVLRQPMRRLVDLYLDYQVWAQRNPKRAGAGRDVPDSPLVQHALAMLDQRLGESLDDDARFDIRPWFGQSSSPPEETPFVDVWSWRGWKAEVQSGSLSLVESATLVGSIEIVGSRLRTVFAHPPEVPTVQAPRATIWSQTAPSDPRRVPWPWVTHSTFWAYERAMNWLDEADKGWAKQLDGAFGSWVAVMTAQLFDVPDERHAFDRPRQALAKNWGSLARRLRDLGETPRANTWLDAVGLLCTPEMGMTTHPEILPAERLEHVASLRRQRAQALPPSLRKLVEPQSTRASRSSRPTKRATLPSKADK